MGPFPYPADTVPALGIGTVPSAEAAAMDAVEERKVTDTPLRGGSEGRTPRRILNLWLARLATDRLVRTGRADPSRPLVTAEKVRGALRVQAMNRLAEEMGITPSQPLAEARALCPALQVADADPSGESKTLRDLARAADRYTPLVGLDPPAGLMLDISGCAHLFGGEAAMLQDVLARFAGWGFAVRGAVAETPLIARALARFGQGDVTPNGEGDVTPNGEGGVTAAGEVSVVPTGEGRAALMGLPAAALMLPEETLAVLSRLGLKTVRQVLSQPRAALVQRFGEVMARRIEAAQMAAAEPITPIMPVAPYVTERRFAEPLIAVEGVAATLAALSKGLCQAMEPRGEGARRFAFQLFHADGVVRGAEVLASEPLCDPKRMAALLSSRLESVSARTETDSGIDLIRLHGFETGPLHARQGALDGGGGSIADLAALVDTLCERLGPAAVCRLAEVDTHVPAEAQRRVSAREALETEPWQGVPTADAPERPIKLFTPPEPVETLASVPDGPPVRFRWRRVFHTVAVAEGPERIAPPWWESEAPTLDYFRVEDNDGRRFWMFREGLYGRETDSPRWFVHGIFA